MADTTMIDTIYSVTALDRDDDERRLFIDREICIEYIVKNWGDDTEFWDFCIKDFKKWCIDHNYEIEMSLIRKYMKYMLNKNIHYFDEYELFEVHYFHKLGKGTFCKIS